LGKGGRERIEIILAGTQKGKKGGRHTGRLKK